jgi:hypothetical protein
MTSFHQHYGALHVQFSLHAPDDWQSGSRQVLFAQRVVGGGHVHVVLQLFAGQ